MKTDSYAEMPPEYEYLTGPLTRAQEHVFLINAEIEKIDGDPLGEAKIVKLQDEKQAVIGGIKQDFEMQTWEDGPARFEEVEKVVDHHFSDDTYHRAKGALLDSSKDYSTSKYWENKLERNIEYFKTSEFEKQAAVNTIRQREWQYEMYGPNSYTPEIGDIDIEPERE